MMGGVLFRKSSPIAVGLLFVPGYLEFQVAYGS